MKSHTKTTLELHDSFDIGKYNGNDESFALSLLSNIMQSIPFISSEMRSTEDLINQLVIN